MAGEGALPSALEGALIERVDKPIRGLYAFSIAASGSRSVLLLAAGPPRPRPRLALGRERPRGEPADGEVRGLREKIEGARIVRTFHTRSSVGFEVRRGEVAFWVAADRHGLSCAPPVPGVLPEGDSLDEASLLAAAEAAETMVAEQRALLAEGARQQAAALLRRARERMHKRARAIEHDLEEVGRAEEKARFASLFVPQAARAKPGTASLQAVDWSSGEAREVWLPLDPKKPPREQLEAVFARAKRLRGGVPVAEKRRDDAELAVMMIDELTRALPGLPDDEAVEQAMRDLARQLPADARLAPRPQQPKARPGEARSRPFRRYESRAGAVILVGRDAASNDELTLRLARPADLWLHAREVPGAHVLVPGWGKRASDEQTLLDAATLAAHFSDRRGEAVVDVIYVERRHLRKRKGSAPGQVEVDREKVLALRVEAERLERLLATCDRDLQAG